MSLNKAGAEKQVLRVAWIGAEPQRGGGVAGCAWLIVEGLIRMDCELDLYTNAPHDELAERLADLRQARNINFDTGWRYDRWYSNHRASKILTGFASRAWGRRRLGSLLVEQHRQQPYDVIYQFSTIEIFGIRRHLSQLPPLVIHPETHAAGELRWVRRERHLAARCEPLWRRIIVECLLTVRARRQRRDVRLASRIAAISQKFGQYLVDDYGVDPSRLNFVPNPIDIEELQPEHHQRVHTSPCRIAFVSRMSARKGVDLVIELSRRLADLEGYITLELVGDYTLWSDYRPLLADLDDRIARYHGPMGRLELIAFLREADLLVQPAKYEPFGLTVGEALAVGVPIIASDEVGAAENVSTECCTVVPAGDVAALEEAVRAHLVSIQRGHGPTMSQLARTEAKRLFSPETVVEAALEMLTAAVQSKDPI
jgi:glycosyltransferase involved in cell wall biosynthesis